MSTRELQKHASEFINLSIDYFCITNPEGYFLDISDNWTSLLGWSIKELLSQPYSAFIHPDDLEKTQKEAEKLIQGSRTITFINRYRKKDGSYCHLNWRSFFKPELNQLFAVASDITELALNKEKLEETTHFLDSIFENIPNMVFVKEAKDLRFIRFNKAGEDIIGCPRGEFIGKNDYDFFPEDQAKFFTQKDREVLEKNQLLDIPEEPLQTVNQETRYLHTKKIPIQDSEGKPLYLLGISEDITERKRIEEENKKVQAQLQQAQKMESIGQLAGGIAHDFNNLLGGILGYSYLLKSKLKHDESLYKKLSIIESSAKRGAKLTQELLGFARKGNYEKKTFDIHDSIKEAVILLEKTLPKNISILTDFDDKLGLIEADSSQIVQIMINLGINARDAMPHGGELKFKTNNTYLDSDFCLKHNIEPGPYIKVIVSDTGQGIPQEIQSKIFEPFFTTKEVGKGTGLGLSMIYGIVQNAQGLILVESEINKGTNFILYLPRIDTSSTKKETENSEDSTSTSPQIDKGILIVDDESIMRSLAQDILEEYGAQVFTANDGNQAVDI